MTARRVATLLGVGATALALYQWRYRHWPCPPWLITGLENPYFEWIAGADRLMERAAVEPGMSVLDAGCGPGRLTLPLADRVGAEGHVVALDLQRAMLDILEERLHDRAVDNVATVHAGLGDGALEPEAFDRAFLVTVLGEIPDPIAALREIRRALRPGGVLSITEVLPDPHYQTKRRVRALARQVELDEIACIEGGVAYTLNLRRPP